jgi:hypothetical protein
LLPRWDVVKERTTRDFRSTLRSSGTTGCHEPFIGGRKVAKKKAAKKAGGAKKKAKKSAKKATKKAAKKKAVRKI